MTPAHHPHNGGLRAALTWLQASLARRAGLSGLSNRDLGDIGVTPRALASAIDRDIGSRGLVDFGWRLGR